MRALAAFLCGALFSVGLVIGGMTLPENVVGFLDFAGEWRPALALVMAGAAGVYAVLYPMVLKRRFPLFAPAFDLPDAAKPDVRLLSGSAAFGVGWGLGGFCPGPAVTALGTGAKEPFVFLGALAAGIALYQLASRSKVPAGDDRTGACG